MTQNTPSNSELTRKIQQSDLDAYELLYRDQFKQVMHFFWIRLQNQTLSEDLTQEVFTRVWTNRHKLNPSKSLLAYIYRIANNLLIDHYRNHRRQKEIPFEVKHENMTDESSIEQKIILQEALDQLPEKLRTVLLYRRNMGLKNAEIAAICGISVKGVEKRMQLAMKQLTKALTT